MNPETGEASVPNASGAVREVRAPTHMNGAFLLDDGPETAKLIQELIQRNGLEAQAAKAQGRQHNPSIMDRVKSQATQNITPVKLIVIGVGVAVTYYLGQKALNALAKYFGWNMFGNVVHSEAAAEEVVDVKKFQSPPRRPSTPTHISASA